MSAKKAILHPDVLIDLQPHSPAEPGWYGPKLRLLFDERDPLLGAMLRQNNNARGIVVRWADVPQVDYFAFAGVIGRSIFYNYN